MRKKSNSVFLIIFAAMLQLFIAAPFYYVSNKEGAGTYYPTIFKAVSLSTVCVGIFLVIISLFLKNQFKVYKVMQEKDDVVKYEVSHGLFGLVFFTFLAIIMQSGIFFLLLSYKETIKAPAVAINAAIILLIFYALIFILFRKDANRRILVGSQYIVSNDSKGKISTLLIDDVYDSHKISRRKSVSTNYIFNFSNGSLDVFDSSFKGCCLIAYMQTVLSARRHKSKYSINDSYYGFPRKYCVETGSVDNMEKLTFKDAQWNIADRKLAKKVKSESKIACILGFVLISFIAGLLYMIGFSALMNLKVELKYITEFTLGYIAIVFAIWALFFKDYILCSFGNIYYLEGTIVRKNIVVKHNFFSAFDYYADVLVNDGYISGIQCTEEKYKSFEPGRDKVMLVKSGISHPQFHFED